MKKQNQHFITRSLTAPWEEQKKGGKRILNYFDFESGSLGQKSSQKMFAMENQWPTEYEKVFNASFESDFSNQKKKIIKGNNTGSISVSWKDFRSVVLLFVIHTLRIGRIYFDDPGALELLKKIYESGSIDHVTNYWAKTYDLVRLALPQDQVLCFPETSYFPFPMKMGFKIGIGFAIPVHPRVMVASIQKGYLNVNWINWLTQNRQFMGYSIGTSVAKRVVVPPGLIEACPTSDLLKAHIRASRVANDGIVRNINAVRKVMG